MTVVADAVVIGGGPNGLVAANALADAGWDVILVEANPEVGGAVRSAEITAPGFCNDLFSAFYPLAAASPVIGDLDLGPHGLTWRHSPAVLSHVLDDGRAAVLSRDPEVTAASVDGFHHGDGDAWLRMFAQWKRVRDPLLDALFTPFPPVRSGMRIARALKAAGTMDLARLAVLPVRRLGQEDFGGDGAALLLTGNAMHADVPPDAAGSGIFGWLLTMLGQDVGYPVPEGGAQRFAEALASRARAAGAVIRTGQRVEHIEIAGGRAVGVRLRDGTRLEARRAVLADVDAPTLYRDLVGFDRLPPRVRRDVGRFQWDHATVKLNWALREPVPWRAAEAHGAGTVHLGVDVDGFVDFAADLSVGRRPERPFLLFGQMTTADPTRSPAGTESAWAYSHVPAGTVDDDARARAARRPDDRRDRAGGAGVLRDGPRPLGAEPRRPRVRRLEPRRRSDQRGHLRGPPGAGLPADPRARPPRDAGARALPRRGVRASRWRRPRSLRLERGPGCDGDGAAVGRRSPGAAAHRVGPAAARLAELDSVVSRRGARRGTRAGAAPPCCAGSRRAGGPVAG
ncbi:phytoene dehydrogenase-like protein [Marmoricola sp. URHA0025 HA25]